MVKFIPRTIFTPLGILNIPQVDLDPAFFPNILTLRDLFP
jgi:hypothetical protein